MKKLVVYTAYYDKTAFTRYFTKLTDEIEIHYVESEEELLGELPTATGLITIPFTEKMLEMGENLEWVQCLRAGVDKYPIEKMNERNLILTNAKGIHRVHMAEYAVGMMIAKQRNFFVMHRNQLKREWIRNIPQDEINGKTVAILGLGAIGREVAKKASLMGMRVIGVKRSPEKVSYVDTLYSDVDMLRAFSEADFVINLLPYIPQTEKLIGTEHFRAMKMGATFMNIGRGKTVDEEALIQKLTEEHISFIGDVFFEEPLPEDSPLWHLENVIMTPHICGESVNYLEKCLEVIGVNLPLFIKGHYEEMINQIDLNVGY